MNPESAQRLLDKFHNGEVELSGDVVAQLEEVAGGSGYSAKTFNPDLTAIGKDVYNQEEKQIGRDLLTAQSEGRIDMGQDRVDSLAKSSNDEKYNAETFARLAEAADEGKIDLSDNTLSLLKKKVKTPTPSNSERKLETLGRLGRLSDNTTSYRSNTFNQSIPLPKDNAEAKSYLDSLKRPDNSRLPVKEIAPSAEMLSGAAEDLENYMPPGEFRKQFPAGPGPAHESAPVTNRTGMADMPIPDEPKATAHAPGVNINDQRWNIPTEEETRTRESSAKYNKNLKISKAYADAERAKEKVDNKTEDPGELSTDQGAVSKVTRPSGGGGGGIRVSIPRELLEAQQAHFAATGKNLDAYDQWLRTQEVIDTNKNYKENIEKIRNDNLLQIKDRDNQNTQAKRHTELQSRVDDLDKQANKLADFKLDPERMWNNKNAGQKLLAGIGIILGGLASARTGRNPAIDMLNTMVDRDIDAQKEAYGAKKASFAAKHTAFGKMSELYKDKDAAEAAAKVVLTDQMIRQMDLLAQNSKNPDVAQKAEAARIALQQKRDDAALQHAQIMYALTHPQVAGGGGPKKVDTEGIMSAYQKAGIFKTEGAVSVIENLLAGMDEKEQIPTDETRNAASRVGRGFLDWAGGQGTGTKVFDTEEEQKKRMTFQKIKAEMRHALYGSALTEYEIKEYDKQFDSATNFGGLRAIANNVKRSAEAQKNLVRAGFEPEQVQKFEEQLGAYNQATMGTDKKRPNPNQRAK